VRLFSSNHTRCSNGAIRNIPPHIRRLFPSTAYCNISIVPTHITYNHVNVKGMSKTLHTLYEPSLHPTRGNPPKQVDRRFQSTQLPR